MDLDPKVHLIAVVSLCAKAGQNFAYIKSVMEKPVGEGPDASAYDLS